MNTKLSLVAALLLATTSGAKADCMGELSAIMEAHKTAGPYHVSMTANIGGKSMKNEIDVILPSSFHMKSDKMETIMLKSGAWMKMGGKWMAMPAQVSAMTTGMIAQGMEQGVKNVKNLQCLGAQTYEGGQFTAYSFDSSAESMGIKATSHITMYTNDKKQPAWMVIDGTTMGKKNMVVQKITFDPAITINPPK